MKTKYIKCACGGELVSLEKWDDEDDEILLSIWERGYKSNDKLTFTGRIRWCWKILKTGRPFTDSIILDNDGINNMIEGLKELKK